MTTALVQVEQNQDLVIQWTAEQANTIRNTVAQNANDDELKMFLHLSQTYGLDPFAKEIWFIKMGATPTIMTSRDGYLKIANNRPDYKGLKSDVVYEGDLFKRVGNDVDHQYSVNKRGGIVGAYALVYRKNMQVPTYVFAPFKDYNKGSSIWKTYPHAMILKVAESMALKRAFSLSGLVSREELDIQQEEEKMPIEAEIVKDETPKQKAATAASATLEKPSLQEQIKVIWKQFLFIFNDNQERAIAEIKSITNGRGQKEITAEDIKNLERYIDDMTINFEPPESEIKTETTDETENLKSELESLFRERLGFTAKEFLKWLKENFNHAVSVNQLKKDELEKALIMGRKILADRDKQEGMVA